MYSTKNSWNLYNTHAQLHQFLDVLGQIYQESTKKPHIERDLTKVFKRIKACMDKDHPIQSINAFKVKCGKEKK